MPAPTGIRSLFLQLGSGQPFQQGRKIEVLVQVDGLPFSQESATVEAGKAAGAVLGVLKARPDLREKLDGWARSGERQVVVAVFVEGRKVQELSWKALDEQSQQIRRTSFQVLDATTTLNVFKPAPSHGSGPLSVISADASSCQDACEQDREACYPETCPGLRSCQECDDQYDLCVISCNPPPPCTDPKNVSYGSAGPEVVGGFWLGSDCLGFGSTGEIYDHIVETLRNYTTQTTEYCDGHSTTTVIGYWDSYWSCDGWTGFVCSYPSGWPGAFCY
ncbi:MAG TPA: hypothetical protein VGS07_30445 [Thermoanaerobaculia bacterium]|nr:hypothetical protein [Thermoanaerobaculia bacterium]